MTEARWVSDRVVELRTKRADGVLVIGEVGWPTAAAAQENVDHAIRLFEEKHLAETVGQCGEGQSTRRFGRLFVSVLWGPPTWWLPRAAVNVRQRRMMVGWLRRGYVLSVSKPRSRA